MWYNHQHQLQFQFQFQFQLQLQKCIPHRRRRRRQHPSETPGGIPQKRTWRPSADRGTEQSRNGPHAKEAGSQLHRSPLAGPLPAFPHHPHYHPAGSPIPRGYPRALPTPLPGAPSISTPPQTEIPEPPNMVGTVGAEAVKMTEATPRVPRDVKPSAVVVVRGAENPRRRGHRRYPSLRMDPGVASKTVWMGTGAVGKRYTRGRGRTSCILLTWRPSVFWI